MSTSGSLLPIGATLRDAAPASGNTTHVLFTYTVPAGRRLLIRRRVVLVDSTDTAAVTANGGTILKVDGATLFNGAEAPAGMVLGSNANAGEIVGPMCLDLPFEASIGAGSALEASFLVRRGGTAITLTMGIAVHGELVPEN
jgi:hypothetical protein